MFDRYTERARRVIFYVRISAGECGSSWLELQHLRAGLFHEARDLFDGLGISYEAPAEEGEPMPTTVDLPMSRASKRALAYAAEESEQLSGGVIRPEHLLLGVLREEGAEVQEIRRILAEGTWSSLSSAAPAIADTLRPLLKRIVTAQEKLSQISDADAACSRQEGKWSAKQILGHLIDSAANNHQRFVRGQLEEFHVSLAYAQDEWVGVQRYQREPWTQLIDLWTAYNRHLVHVLAGISTDKLAHRLKVGDSEPVTLEFWVGDYVAHLEKHLKQISV